MLIGEMAKKLGVSVSLLRKLEGQGVIPEPDRGIGPRNYPNEDFETIKQALIKRYS